MVSHTFAANRIFWSEKSVTEFLKKEISSNVRFGFGYFNARRHRASLNARTALTQSVCTKKAFKSPISSYSIYVYIVWRFGAADMSIFSYEKKNQSVNSIVCRVLPPSPPLSPMTKTMRETKAISSHCWVLLCRSLSIAVVRAEANRKKVNIIEHWKREPKIDVYRSGSAVNLFHEFLINQKINIDINTKWSNATSFAIPDAHDRNIERK